MKAELRGKGAANSKYLAAGLFAVLAAALAVPGAHAYMPMIFWGNLTINSSGVYNVTPDGANITAHINGSDRINATVKAGVGVYFGSTTTAASGYFLIPVQCNSGDNVSLRVYNATATFKVFDANTNTLGSSALSGFPCSTGTFNTTFGTNVSLNFTSLQSGAFCTDNGACISGNCRSDYDGVGSWCVPTGSCAHDGTVYGNGEKLCSSLSTLQTCTSSAWIQSSCTTCANGVCTNQQSPTTPSTTPTTPATETNVTDVAAKSEIIKGISPQDLGLTGTLAAGDVTVKQIGTSAETTAQTTSAIADLAVQMATDADAKSAIEAIKANVAAGNDIDVKVSLTVYKVESPSTGLSVYVSKVTLSFTAASDMKDVGVVQIIPKSIAADIANVTFLGGAPAVLQSDPIVRWSFPDVGAGQTKDMSYTVKKQLSSTSDITTLAAAGNITAPQPGQPATPQEGGTADNTWMWALGIIVIIVIIAALFFFLRK